MSERHQGKNVLDKLADFSFHFLGGMIMGPLAFGMLFQSDAPRRVEVLLLFGGLFGTIMYAVFITSVISIAL